MRDNLLKIRNLSAQIANRKMQYSMRRRFNPHHPKEDVAYEWSMYDHQQRRDFFELKELFVQNREALIKLEGLTKEDRDTFQALDQCIADDLEREFGLDEGCTGFDSDD